MVSILMRTAIFALVTNTEESDIPLKSFLFFSTAFNKVPVVQRTHPHDAADTEEPGSSWEQKQLQGILMYKLSLLTCCNEASLQRNRLGDFSLF